MIYPIGKEAFAYQLNFEDDSDFLSKPIIKKYSIKVLNDKIFSNWLPKGITKIIDFISPCANNIRDKIVDKNGNILKGWKFLQIKVKVTNLLNRTILWPNGQLSLKLYNIKYYY